MTIPSRVLFFTAALAFAFMGCPGGGGGNTGGGTGTTGGGIQFPTGGGTSVTTGGGTATTGGGTATTGGGTATTGGGTATTGGGDGTTGGGTATTGGGTATTGGGTATTGGGTATTGGGTATTGGGTATTGGGTATTGGGTATTGGGTGTTGGGTGTTGGGIPTNCTEVTLSGYTVSVHNPSSNYVGVRSQVSPALGSADPDRALIEAYSDLTLGTYDLSAAPDDNYSTCARCITVAEDLGAKQYFQVGGSYVLSAVDATAGTMTATLTDVTLVEVSIDPDTLESTPVANGACLHITSANVSAAYVAPPSGWTCSESYYNDSFCECGCGVQDPDCASTTDETECLACSCSPESVDGGFLPSACDMTDTTQCSIGALIPWTCSPSTYGDGTCQCGCGTQDSDCMGTTDINECTSCGCAPQSTDGGFITSACSASDTSQCSTGSFVSWTCDPSYYGDGSYCDCGCGGQDSDCTSTTDLSQCDGCGCATSSSTDGGILVSSCDGTNTTVCTAPSFVVWSCNPSYYGDSDCDCGCGSVDFDCADATLASCDFCSDTGGCSTQSCSTNTQIDPTNNAVCLP